MALGLPPELKIAGHKIPWPAIGALAGVAGVILVLRARAGGTQIAAAGTAPALADQTSVGVLGQGQEAQLANLGQQLFDLQQSLTTTVTPAPAPAAAPPPPPPTPVVGPPIVPGPQLWNFVHGVGGTPGPIITPQWGSWN